MSDPTSSQLPLKSQWKLKVLSTKYQGAEIILTENQLLGRNEKKADLVIDEPGIFDEHINIISTDKGVKLELLNDNLNILVNEEAWCINETLPELTNIHIGQLIIMVAPQDIDWPLNIITTNQAPATEESKTENTKSKLEQITKSSIDKSHLFYKHASKFVLGGACLAVAFTLSVYSETSPQNTVIVNNAITPEKIVAKFQSKSQPHLLAKWNDKKHQLNLSGYVETINEKKSIKQKAESLNIRFTSKIRTMEEIKAGANFILKNLRLEFEDIKSGDTPGSLVFITNANNLNSWRKLDNILQKDIPGLTSWELEILEEKPVMQQLKNMLAETSFADKLSIQDRGERIELTGNLVGAELREFKLLKKGFKTKYGNYPYLVLQTPAANSEYNFNLDIKSVRFGNAPYITLHSGKKYFEGGQLPNGYRVSSINSDNVAFKKASKTIVISLKQN